MSERENGPHAEVLARASKDLLTGTAGPENHPWTPSTEEKMNLTARLLTELAERKERVALLKFKLHGFAIALDMAGLASGAICAHPDDETQDQAIRKMPNVDEVLAVCAELRAEAKRYEVLKVQASHLGL